MDNFSSSVLHYFKANKITGSVIVYILFAAILKATTTIDIGIPCLWRMLFEVECPGCGLATAFNQILVLDFERAYEANRLILILLPAAMIYLFFDFLKFKQRKQKVLKAKVV